MKSGLRWLKAVGGGVGVFMKKGQGGELWDVDEKGYIDYVGG